MRELTAEEVLAKYEMLGQNSQQRSRRGSSGTIRDIEMAKNVATLTRDVQTMMRNLECTSTSTSPNTMIQSFNERPPMESCIMGNQNQNQGQLVVRENQANWVGRRPMNGSSSNSYNRGWDRLPNRYWSNPNNFLNPPEDLENRNQGYQGQGQSSNAQQHQYHNNNQNANRDRQQFQHQQNPIDPRL